MPVITSHAAVNPALLNHKTLGWRRMVRIDTTGANVQQVVDAIVDYSPGKLVYAEGDSWFDKFTPIPLSGTNLLDAIRTPFHTAVVDVSHIGDEVRDMVRGHQARQTQAMFRFFSFDAILLSAGGNDLKNLFGDLFAAKALRDSGSVSTWLPEELDELGEPRRYRAFFDEVVTNIGRFVDLRDAAKDEATRKAPIFVHGYDYFQPRPAGAAVFVGSRIGGGPWLYPSMHAAGLDARQMRSAADAVVDELNEQLASRIAPLSNVFVIDQRGLLTPAEAASEGQDGDWLDEIHPDEKGFATLARNRWDVPVSRALGWAPAEGDLVESLALVNRTTAHVDSGASSA